MGEALKNTILRVLISAIIFSFISGIVVTIVGLILHWKTYIQFSDTYFWVGAGMIALGFLNVLGGRNQSVSGLQTSESAVSLDGVERTKQWAADISRGYNLLAFLGTSGLLLIGMSWLALVVGKLF
jgi:hypothetical protein